MLVIDFEKPSKNYSLAHSNLQKNDAKVVELAAQLKVQPVQYPVATETTFAQRLSNSITRRLRKLFAK